jgi:hypothetical protein
VNGTLTLRSLWKWEIRKKILHILVQGYYGRMKERLYDGRKSSTRECVKVMELASVFFFFFFFAFISPLKHDISSFEFDVKNTIILILVSFLLPLELIFGN